MYDPMQFSLADFYDNDNPNVLSPPTDFLKWLEARAVQEGMSFFEQPFLTMAGPRIQAVDHLTGRTRSMINMTSYSYMGLGQHPEVIAAAHEALDQYGLGASGAPKLSGTFIEHTQFAAELAAFKGKEDCLITPSGYQGNLAGIAGLLRPDDVMIMDQKSHQSIIDGARLARCKIKSFRHNDPDHLDRMLKKFEGQRRLVVIEGVYSMDGDLPKLPAIAEVIKRHEGVGLYLDEAHSTLMFGEHGRGVAEHFGCEDAVGLSFGTLSKSFGGVGGFVCASRPLITYLKCYATAMSFSCAPPPAIVAGLRKALEVATRDSTLRDRLWENTRYFTRALREMGLYLGDCESQVIPIILGIDRPLLYDIARNMQDAGLFLQPVDYPAVEPTGTRFRISMSAAFTRADLDEALTIIQDCVVARMKVEGKPLSPADASA